MRTLVGLVLAVALVGANPVGAGPAEAAPAEAADELWTPLTEVGPGDPLVEPEEAAPFRLDVDALSALLQGTVSRRAGAAPTELELPDPNGELVRFAVQPLTVMEPELAAAHPEIVAVAGRGIDDPGLSVRADLSPLGLHASVRSADGSTTAWYLDPALRGDASTSVSYPAGALRDERSALVEPEAPQTAEPDAIAQEAAAPAPGADVPLRTVRVAFASDPSFAAFYGSDAVLAAKVSIVTRVGGLFNDDLGVHLTLADGTDRLNFDTVEKAEAAGYTTPALATCGQASLDQNSAALERLLGVDGYDVGHLLLGVAGGGLAGYAEVGLPFVKGGGCTGDPNPVGDGFAVDYVAHELGHQFGGSHTFNACGGSSGATAVEPGSGSTVMAYAGICGANDLQPHSDPYFSQASIAEIQRTLARLPATASGNRAPVVTAPPDRELPLQTPFTLVADGSDPDGDPLGYLWEQNDVGDPDRALSDGAKTAGPLVRVFGRYAAVGTDATRQYSSPGENPVGTDPGRTIPDLEQILGGATNAGTGACDPALTGIAALECHSESLPTAAYADDGALDFRVTARDQDPAGGGVAHDDVRLTLARDAGPFLVTSQGDATEVLRGGATTAVTWSVNGTDRAGLAPTVRIRLSTDGGRSFDTVLADATANDGSETVTVPNVASSAVRIRVDAVDNYFFDLSDADVTIAAVPRVDPVVDRIGGADRFVVSAAVARQAFPDGADTVYVASGAVFPDALSAAPAAARDRAPVLLTRSDRLPDAVVAEITRLDPERVVVVGGPLSVGPAVAEQLAATGAEVTRIGGPDRFAVSRSVAEAAFPDGASTAVLATGTDFPDALSAGAAVAGQSPVLLVDGRAGSLDAATRAVLERLGVTRLVVVGGELSVSAGLAADAGGIAPVTRLAGADRYATSIAVVAHFVDAADRALLATGRTFPDALSGSPLGLPVLVVPPDCLPGATRSALGALGVSRITLLGGEAGLTAGVQRLDVCPGG
ncbi:cell wall-binding repeat-containing protein [Herbiconiux sp. VKM Ac-2851]|uniref:cell wall-binding repeat-containing protein n=1 Tax=Herbiconiux sp. VKM Ac-2851 TaxID=2739025 RepID=UPI001566FB29|nr:cell wall-binding repeat-containing protein [Herbiconiux sp. VKM Ac-2851]NQX35430.1 cell wall-binding repeat-containing protein [Herbiconiux sp. VKM Ac-2851]